MIVVSGSSMTVAGRVSVGVGAERSIWQSDEQPSLLSIFPSSQSSSGVSRMVSPQRPMVQSGLQRALGLSLFSDPSSHCSPLSLRALPQKGGRRNTSCSLRHSLATQNSLVPQGASREQAEAVMREGESVGMTELGSDGEDASEMKGAEV